MNQNKTFYCAFILLNNITSNGKDLNDCFEKRATCADCKEKVASNGKIKDFYALWHQYLFKNKTIHYSILQMDDTDSRLRSKNSATNQNGSFYALYGMCTDAGTEQVLFSRGRGVKIKTETFISLRKNFESILIIIRVFG